MIKKSFIKVKEDSNINHIHLIFKVKMKMKQNVNQKDINNIMREVELKNSKDVI